jgi:hypothetical protein
MPDPRTPMLARDQLDQLRCATPGCDCDGSEFFFSANCHPDAAVDVRYRRADGAMILTCNACERPVASILVAAHLHG